MICYGGRGHEKLKKTNKQNTKMKGRVAGKMNTRKFVN